MKAKFARDAGCIRPKNAETGYPISFAFNPFPYECQKEALSSLARLSLGATFEESCRCDNCTPFLSNVEEPEEEVDEIPIAPPTTLDADSTANLVPFRCIPDRVVGRPRIEVKPTRKVSTFISEIFLGRIPDEWPIIQNPSALAEEIRRIEDLKESQVSALEKAFRHPLSLIQGPPGTEKTRVIAEYVSLRLKVIAKGCKILVCAPSNVSVENVTLRIASFELNVVRLASRTLDGVPSPAAEYTVFNLIMKSNEKTCRVFADLHRKKRDDYLTPEEDAQYGELRHQLEREFCARADVICCTLTMAGQG
jgi:hypothetical protein